MKSITRRLVILFGTAAAAVLVGLGFFVSTQISKHFDDGDRHELVSKMQFVRHMLESVETTEQLDAALTKVQNYLQGHDNLVAAIYSPDAQWVISERQRPLLTSFEKLRQRAMNADVFTESYEHEAKYNVYASPVTTKLSNIPVLVAALALDTRHHIAFKQALDRSLVIAVAISITVMIAVGMLVARRGLRPLHNMTMVVQSVSADKLHDRLDVSVMPTELKPLGEAYNNMLTRLSDSFRRLSDFSADIAHELRTPLSNLVLQTQVILSQQRNIDDYREALFSNLEEYERLSRMIADMLFLAKSDNDMLVLQRESIAIENEIQKLFDYFSLLAEERGVNLRTAGSATIRADRAMLQRAMSNLIVNAINHTTRGGEVEVSVDDSAGRIRITVSNPGSYIPPEHLPRLFDRFYRVDAARQRSSEGSGLGLAITKSIVNAHKGHIHVTSQNNITQFCIELPNT